MNARTPTPRIAIVSMGGLFPSLTGPATPEQLWSQVLQGIDTARPAPPGRWLLDSNEVFVPAMAVPDRVYSSNGCFLDPLRVDPMGLDLPSGLLAELDPVFHL